MNVKKRTQRTPRNFDGTEITTRKIDLLLTNILSQIEQKAKTHVDRIEERWKEVVGEKMAPMTEVLSLENGILTVKVKNSTLYSLLCQHEKPRLLGELQKKCSKEKLRDLKFRIG
jgi:predicted nucleic acid-binding Zn ribbon protein